MSRIIVSGPTGGAPNRLEIRDFIKNEKFFSLYIQALQAMQKDDQSNPLSSFQIGGIHGLPYKPWNGVQGTSSQRWGGYCTHGTVLFPTWHRPYVALYEQAMQDHAKKIAATYSVDPTGWKKAGDEIRQPYWDWAVNTVPPDEVIALKQVTIVTPDGKRTAVDNPLYNYTFHPVDSSFPSDFQKWRTTLRQPTTEGADATDNVALLRNILRNVQLSTTAKTYNMLTRVNTWPAFSNHTVGDDGSGSNSLEAIHDGIHYNVGGLGHMGNTAVAGFDPIFYLHHCNVDRMLSLWSALHPGVWVTPGKSRGGSFTIPPNDPVDTNTALTPFNNGETTFWASAATVNTAQLGYSYPDFNGLDMGNKEAVRVAIAKRVNQLYGTSVFGGRVATDSVAGGLSSRTAPAPDTAPPNRGLYEWSARVECKQFEIPISYLVAIFVGQVPEDPKQWQVSPNYVGSHYAFVNSAAQECANCRDNADVVIEGYVHLNQAIARHSGLQSLEPDAVLPYLKDNLHWRVLKVNGEPAKLDSLEVTVHAAPLSYPDGAIFPVAGKDHSYDHVTYGVDGGCRRAPGH